MAEPGSDPRRAWLREALARYEQPLLRYAAHLTGDAERTRDVVQDAFMKLCADRSAGLGDAPATASCEPQIEGVCPVCHCSPSSVSTRGAAETVGGTLSPRGVRMPPLPLEHAHAEYSESMPPAVAHETGQKTVAHDRPDPNLNGDLAAWLFAVCRNRALDIRRKARRMFATGEAALDARRNPSPGPAAAEQSDLAAASLRLLAGLPARQQQIVLLKFHAGCRLCDIPILHP